ncbi:MAG: hypothetical protein IJ830_06120 [Alphaproteobacteria bacterium]|nr:hypothetical protein [Alphaproteobacteria bacterium]
MKKNENGRSMVEMLGVLAIIGVLSAGALAGYSKAMTQHRLNKHADEISYLMATVIFNADKLKEGSDDMIDELRALNAYTWPIEIKSTSSQQYVLDSFHNNLFFENHAKHGGGYAIEVELIQSDFMPKICYNYINVFKNLAQDLDMIYAVKRKSGKRERDTYAGKTCTTGRCLKSMTNTDIINLCQRACEGSDSCSLYALWDYPASSVQSLLQ